MSKKRGATSELNHDNWDQDDEQDDSEKMLGGFAQASPEQLRSRVIRVAKRKLPSGSNTASPFSAFGGFGASSSNTSTVPKPNFGALLSNTNKQNVNEASKAKETNKDDERKNKKAGYYSKLRKLNQSVAEWITEHVSDDANCYLSPIFKDYEKHLKHIRSEYLDDSDSDTSIEYTYDEVDNNDEKKSLEVNKSSFSFGSSTPTSKATTDKASESKPAEVNKPLLFVAPSTTTFSFGAKKDEEKKDSPPQLFAPKTTNLFGSNTDSSKPTFSFGSSSTTPSFGFGSGSIGTGTSNAGFSFNALAAKVAEQRAKGDEAGGDEESEEPPKVEFKPVEEEGSVFDMKCKVFVKKDNEYKDKGVGMLYLKKVADDKVQLLVRTATTTGQILLNTLVTSDLRPMRQGKNNVQIVCIPTPQEKPTITLLRVKTGEDADLLLTKIQEHIK